MLAKLGKDTLVVSELNREIGELTERGTAPLGEGMNFVAGQEDGVYLLNSAGVWQVNPEESSKEIILSFTENYYTFEMAPTNFQVTAEGNVKLLQVGKVTSLDRVNMAESRKVVVLSECMDMPEIEECIEKFNAMQDTYFVAWEMLKEKQSVTEYKD